MSRKEHLKLKGAEVSCCVKYLLFGFNIVFWFSVFLGLIFFLELTAGILAFVFKDWIKDQLNFFINNNVKAYRDDIDLQNLIDFAQEYWLCCGAHGPNDWNQNIYFNCTELNPSRERCGVPFSCCIKDPAEDVLNTQCGYDVRLQGVSEGLCCSASLLFSAAWHKEANPSASVGRTTFFPGLLFRRRAAVWAPVVGFLSSLHQFDLCSLLFLFTCVHSCTSSQAAGVPVIKEDLGLNPTSYRSTWYGKSEPAA
uniref:Tetraspanin 17 n=1 Tax=Scleropages formosus TaxID=113540 RepID=A0A8C9SSQ6_SCLFO